MLVDTHTHLNMAEFDKEREAVVQRAVQAGVEWMVDVGTDLESSKKTVQISERFDAVWGAVGIHPHHAADSGDSTFVELKKLLSNPRIKALGEIGLDYHCSFAPRKNQTEVFERQLRLALSVQKPVIVHVREAMFDALEIIQKMDVAQWEGVFHCFGGSAEDIPKLLDLGFYISFTGVVTFPNFTKRNLIRNVPLNRFLVETDAPYMAPVPLRGRRNEPAYLVYTAKKMAEILEVPFELFSAETTQNAKRLFRLEK